MVNPGEKEYIGSTVDGDGNEIKIYKRSGVETLSINQVAKREGLTTQEAYKKYGINVFRTTNAQTSIRTRVMDYRKEAGVEDEYLSIEYIPKTGKNRGVVYEQLLPSSMYCCINSDISVYLYGPLNRGSKS